MRLLLQHKSHVQLSGEGGKECSALLWKEQMPLGWGFWSWPGAGKHYRRKISVLLHETAVALLVRGSLWDVPSDPESGCPSAKMLLMEDATWGAVHRFTLSRPLNRFLDPFLLFFPYLFLPSGSPCLQCLSNTEHIYFKNIAYKA